MMRYIFRDAESLVGVLWHGGDASRAGKGPRVHKAGQVHAAIPDVASLSSCHLAAASPEPDLVGA